jgi:hypothetical protein
MINTRPYARVACEQLGQQRVSDGEADTRGIPLDEDVDGGDLPHVVPNLLEL